MDIFNIKALVIAFLVFVPLERLFGLHAEQKVFRRGFTRDVVYALVNGIIIKSGLILLIVAAMGTVGLLVPSTLHDAVAGQPIWLQVAEIIFIADLGFYFAHRAFHAVPFLWRFHAIHHSIEELDWLVAYRIHFVDLTLTKAASLIPVALLGFDVAAIGLFGLLFHAHGLLQHANLKISFGPLRWIIASPQFHHWHHANARAAYDKNFAGQLAFLDTLFGTMHLPGNDVPNRYGIDHAIEGNYFQQLIHPFVSKAKTNDAVVRDA